VRTNDLNALLDAMSADIGTIQAANNGISAITKLVQSAGALVSQAQQTAATTVRATLASQFDALLPQIGQLAGDSGLNGINLLAGNDLTITMNEDGTSTVVVAAFNNTAAGDLAINSSANNWATDADISTASAQLTTALTALRSQTQALSSNLSTVQIREDFTKAMINTLNNGADSPTLADSNEEGVNLLALQTRQQLSATALSLAAQADQNVLRLFRKAQQPDASQAIRPAPRQL
jgi:flagellin